jgi:hypothetical protein
LNRGLFVLGSQSGGWPINWVMLTLRVYAHAMREEENDLSFAEFGSSSKRLYPAPKQKAKS